MGLLDHYRQFEAMTEEEVNSELRAQAAERRREELARSDVLDLSQTTWHELPDASVVNAITFATRSGLQRYPNPRAGELRSELAHMLGVEPTRLALGHGVAQLLGAAATALLEPGDELVTLWPSYPLYPALANRARAKAIPVSLSARPGKRPQGAAATAARVSALLAAAGERTRVLAVASPNDPTGEILPVPALAELLAALPDEVAVLVDQALVEFADGDHGAASLALLAEHPRMIVFRTLSKAWGLAGLRFGYAVGGPGAEELLSRMEPDLGVGELTQVGALEALRSCAELVKARTRRVARERSHLTGELGRRGFHVAESQANFLWCAHSELSGDQVASALRSAGVLVASGAGLGEPGHVRITLRGASASERLLAAVDEVLARHHGRSG
ncbi:MAG: aminotransferase class I/II-fold pyridoxal phosphate-dependent enzyme [Acidobacteriota bacterium]|nr:aminotransferase class I/II-fold pyridoxal phosphate-dependent enzyme [Acidobacteriota bacterium]